MGGDLRFGDADTQTLLRNMRERLWPQPRVSCRAENLGATINTRNSIYEAMVHIAPITRKALLSVFQPHFRGQRCLFHLGVSSLLNAGTASRGWGELMRVRDSCIHLLRFSSRPKRLPLLRCSVGQPTRLAWVGDARLQSCDPC